MIEIPRLDPSIRYQGSPSPREGRARRALLTGVTGLLGANLLHIALRHGSEHVYCLVRAGDTQQAWQRVVEALRFHGEWREEYRRRLTPVPGDLGAPQLGLSSEEYQELAHDVDVILHCGANTNLVLPHAQLSAANVGGTENLLHLASIGHRKLFHHASTLAVLPQPRRERGAAQVLLETCPPSSEIPESAGYVSTKILAEHLLLQARRRGLPASIYRLGRIMGHSYHGRMPSPVNVPCMIWKISLLLGMYPKTDKDWSFIPVDFAARAIDHLCHAPQHMGKTFHLHNRHSVAWKTLFETTREYGYRMVQVPLAQWSEAVRREVSQAVREGGERAVEFSLLSSSVDAFFLRRHDARAISTYHLLEGLRGTSIRCPRIDRRLLRTYIAYFERSGFFPRVPSSIVEKWRRASAAARR